MSHRQLSPATLTGNSHRQLSPATLTGNSHRPDPRKLLGFAFSLLLAPSVGLARQQPVPPQVSFPKVIAYGAVVNGNENVREVDVAAGGGKAMVVFIHNRFEIGYSFFDGTTWTEGTLGAASDDPSVVYARWTPQVSPTPPPIDGFICCWKRGDEVLVSHFDISQPGPAYSFGPEISIGPSAGGVNVDKPWLVAGDTSTSGTELHATWFQGFNPPNFYYARGSVGGASAALWSFQTIQDRVSGTDIQGGAFPQATSGGVSPGGPLIVAYPVGTMNRWQFLMGSYFGGSTPTAWEFEPLEHRDASGVVSPLKVVPNSTLDTFNFKVPGPFRVLRVPYVVADPTNLDRVYFVYHDLAQGSTDDMDVFCRVLTRSGSFWSVGGEVRINDDPFSFGDDKDQFIPGAAVDEVGRLHVAYYDDRRYDQADTDTPTASFDVFYAVSLDQGANFTNIRLTNVPDDPLLDTDPAMTTAPDCKQTPGEYPGIATDGNTVWIAFSGTNPHDTSGSDKSVIYVSKVTFQR